MPRIPYLKDEEAGPPTLVAAIRQRRGGALLHLDRLLLHSPVLAEGWSAFMGRVRSDFEIQPRLRELAICAVGGYNGVDYELHHHGPLFLAEGGRQAQLDALCDLQAAVRNRDLFDHDERTLLQFTLEMTRDVKVSDACFDQTRQVVGSERRLLEFAAVIAAYNMASRLLASFDIQPE